MPEGRVPATVGEKCIILSAERYTTLTPDKEFRFKRLDFSVNVIRRTRDTANDRLGIIYTGTEELANTHEIIFTLIESLAMFNVLRDQHALAPSYNITRSFIHYQTNLDPIHLYENYFYSGKRDKEDGSLDSKISGYKTSSLFASPAFSLLNNPLAC